MVRGVADAVQTGQARFDLVLGPRGAGKSHLLGLIEGRLGSELEGAAIVAGPPEEFHPSSLVHLLAEILRSLPPDPQAEPVERQLAILAASHEDARDRAVGMIRGRLRGLPLVIVIENLDVVFAAIGRSGQSQLRSILQTERRWSIVATSRSRAPAFSKESEPFFGTFIPRVLEPLSGEGCRDLLVRLARASEREDLARELDTPRGLARVRTLRHVMGGYPRAMAFIFPHLHHERPDAVEAALRDLAEELTPYFQEQMSRLPAGQRPVAELLAERWAPLSVSEIARATFNSQPAVSTYLRRMREDALVRSTKLGREHFYEIADPLFRIARAMKRDDLRVKTFLRVLQSWYELRGVDIWRLPFERAFEIRGHFSEDNEHIGSLLEPVFQMLLAGQDRQALEAADAVDSDHSLRIAYQIVACSNLGDDERAFELLSSRRLISVHVVSGVAAWSLSPTRSTAGGHAGHTARSLLATKFCTAVVSLLRRLQLKESPLPDEVADIERPLRSESPTIRAAATEVLLDLLVPGILAHRREFETCGRLVELLGPTNTEAMSLNLVMIVPRAWAADQLTIVFRDPKTLLSTSGKNLGAIARAGMLLALSGGTALPHDDIEAALEAASREGLRMNPADQLWMKALSFLMLPVITNIVNSPAGNLLARQPPEFQSTIVDMVHTGILCSIAAGRDLTPVISALSLDERLANRLGVGTESSMVSSPSPDVAFVRLAAPERAAVRQWALFFGLEERHAALRELSNDDDEQGGDS